MDFSNFRPESHVAQQSRRDKLRVQQSSTTAQSQHLEAYPNNQGLNPDVFQVPNVRYGNISYNPAMFSSQMLNFAVTKDAMEVVHQESIGVPPDHRQIADEIASVANSTHPISSPKVSGGPQSCGTWKSIGGSQQSCDWIGNYSSGLTSSESNHNNPLFVNSIASSSFSGYQYVVQSSLINSSSEISSQNREKGYEEMQFNSLPLYQNAQLADGVTLATAGPGSWSDGGNELPLLPNCGDQSIPLRLNDASSAWMSRPEEGCHHQWSTSELGFLASKSDRDLRSVASDSNTHGLSLSLSHGGQFGEDLHSGTTGVFNDLRNLKPSIDSSKNTCQDMIRSSTFTHRNTGPLGPFTGYATILKGSRFLKPAQKLLDEICIGSDREKPIKKSEVSDKVSADAGNAAKSMVGLGDKGGDHSGVLSSTIYSSNEIRGEGGVGSSSGESYGPEFQQKKAKLLFMQEEVCRRYKQYHQQMQMVVSSFESVAGLSAATPYISLALKTVSKHFRCLKNAISDQLRYIRKALGEDLSSPTTCASSRKGDDRSTSKLTFADHSFSKQKSGGGNLSFFEAQQHIWRPQRGLPERSVAVLRAWLFEHFLHPYPTDTDKQMLANQTGLSRNQVSNWFINARVRVWKPMVEEIHMLETKGLAEPNSNMSKNDGRPAAEGAGCSNSDQIISRLGVISTPGEQVECLQIGSLSGTGVGQNAAEQWNQDKRSRLHCQIPATMDGSLMGGFVPYQRSGLEIGGLGAVSLTLGLRQSAESSQQQQQQQLQQQHEHQLMQHFGGQMIHDFVG
ncbi:hypothetical protein CsSME_00040712 [Camellia sinensis var. sinensis]